MSWREFSLENQIWNPSVYKTFTEKHSLSLKEGFSPLVPLFPTFFHFLFAYLSFACFSFTPKVIKRASVIGIFLLKHHWSCNNKT